MSLTISSMARGPDGLPQGILTIARDISERKRMALELDKTAEALGELQARWSATRGSMLKGWIDLMSQKYETVFQSVLAMQKIARGVALFAGVDDEDVQRVEEAVVFLALGRLIQASGSGDIDPKQLAALISSFAMFDDVVPILMHYGERYAGLGSAY